MTAESDAQVYARVGNEATSSATALIGAAGAAGSGVLASNLVSSTAQAYIEFTTPGTVTAGGALKVAAEDNAGSMRARGWCLLRLR